MDAARTLDYPNFVAGSLTTPPGQDVPDMSGPTCCRGLAFIAADFMYDELRQLNPVQELHRRFWSLMTAGSSLTGSLYFFRVLRYVPLDEPAELPALQGSTSMFFRGPTEVCTSCLQSLVDKHDDIAGADDGLYDVCLFMPRAFI